MDAVIIRTHGDYHMGQVLSRGDDFVILDFEGEPLRSLEARRRKQCPLRDVAGVLRSIHYAVSCTISHEDAGVQQALRARWITEVSKAFLEGYFEAAAGAEGPALLPPRPEDARALIEIFVLEKALYELKYEMHHRPDWIWIPLSGLLDLCARSPQ